MRHTHPAAVDKHAASLMPGLVEGSLRLHCICTVLLRSTHTAVPLQEMEPMLGVLVIVLMVAACYPGSEGPRPARQKPPEQPMELLKYSASRLFEQLQRLSGRAACLGLAGTITAEVVTGKVNAIPRLADKGFLRTGRNVPGEGAIFDRRPSNLVKPGACACGHVEAPTKQLGMTQHWQCGPVCHLQGALTLLNVETGVEALTEVEAVLAFLGLLILTEDVGNDNRAPDSTQED